MDANAETALAEATAAFAANSRKLNFSRTTTRVFILT